MKIRHIIIILIFVLINVIVLISLATGMNSSEETAEEKEEFIPTLSAAEVHNAEETFKVVGYGNVSAFNAVDVACEVQGKLTQGRRDLKVGVRFKKGELLFKINDTDAQYNLRARKSGFINIIVNLLPDLQIDFPSEAQKWTDYLNAIKLNKPLPQLPAWKSTKEKVFLSTRNVLTEYFSIKSLEEQLEKYSVYAPFSGMVTEVYATNFSVVNPGTRILRLTETDNYEIPVSIPTDQIDDINEGTEVSIFTTLGDLKGKGVVVRMAEMINKNTQSIDVYVKPQAIDGKTFTEGEYVRVEMDKMGTHNGVRLPENAIDDNRVMIYSKKDSTLSSKSIQIANKNSDGVFVKGLKENVIVITQEVLNYTDTSKYKVLVK